MANQKVNRQTLHRMEVLTASTSHQASWLWEAAQKEEVGSPLGGFLLDISAQGAQFAQDFPDSSAQVHLSQ